MSEPENSISMFIPVLILQNYRSHPAILMPPSAIFYDDSLEPCAQNGTITWTGLPNAKLPFIFIGCSSEEKSVDEVSLTLYVHHSITFTIHKRASWFNDGEIKKVVDTITSLLAEGESSTPPLQAAHVGVMAPWRGQVWKIRECLRKKKLSKVDVGTVEVRPKGFLI